MKPFCRFLTVLALSACQADERATTKAEVAARADTAYSKDIAKLCDSLALSGADKMERGERMLPLANWLAANLTTTESRQFLVQIQPLVGNAKANALEAEAGRVGLGGCALAVEWRAPS